MKCYVIANYSIKEEEKEKYLPYPPAATKTTFQYGGKVLVANIKQTSEEGSPERVTVILEFESREAAESWYNSEEYRKIRHLRTETMTSGWLQIVDGFELNDA